MEVKVQSQIKHLSGASGLCYGYFLSHVSVVCRPDIHIKNAFDEPGWSKNPVGEWPAWLCITLYNMSEGLTDVVKPAIEN